MLAAACSRTRPALSAEPADPDRSAPTDPTAGASAGMGGRPSDPDEGGAEVEYEWRPWWLAPEEATRGTMTLAVDVRDVAVQDPQPGVVASQLKVDARVEFSDSAGRFAASFETTFSGFGDPGDAFLRARFADELLARQLDLPQAVPGQSTDPFVFELERAGNAWRFGLSSARNDAWCPLLGSPRPVAPACDRTDSELGLTAHMEYAELALDDTVQGGITPRAVVDAMTGLGDLQLTWPDSDSTGVEVFIESEELACVAHGGGLLELANGPGYLTTSTKIGDDLTQLLVPVRFFLASEDQRLRVGLPGSLLIDIWQDTGWDGTVRASSGLANARQRLPAGFEVPDDRLAFLWFTLGAPSDRSFPGRVTMVTLKPYPGVPEYPDTAEPLPDRLRCFGEFAPPGPIQASISRTHQED